MKKYLLLRNNKQSGPYSYEELMEMGLKAHDLLWVDGKSAAWRYPVEFDEFKINPAVEKDSLSDRSFTNLQNDLLIYRPENVTPVHEFPDDELIEFPTMARFMENGGDNKREKIISTDIIPVESGISEPTSQDSLPVILNVASKEDEPYQAEKLPSVIAAGIEINQVKEIVPEISADIKKENEPIVKSRVSVTLPAAAIDNTRIVIHPKDITARITPAPELEPDSLNEMKEIIQPVSPIVLAESGLPMENELKDIPIPGIEQGQINIPENAVFEKEKVEDISPFELVSSTSAPLQSESPFPARMAVKIKKENEIIQEKTEPAPVVPLMSSGNSTPLIQKLAVAAAIISLLGVAGLITNSILNPDAYNYTTVKSTTESNITDAKIKAGASEVSGNQNTALNQPVPPTAEPPSVNALPADNKQPTAKPASGKKGKLTQDVSTADSQTAQPVQADASTVAFTKQEKENVVDPKAETRKNINSLVTYSMNNFKVNTFGGVSDFEVTVTNGSSYPLDLVVVELKYIQSNKKVYKTERLEFKGVAPKGKQTIGVPKSNRGIKVETSITNITSHDLDLTYQNN